jgi:hypothetical protein
MFGPPMVGNQKGKSMIQDVDAEQLARVFHHYQEALAHDCDSANVEASSAWERAPQNERRLLVAAARLTLLELAAPSTSPSPARKYYAKPGEADWGC